MRWRRGFWVVLAVLGCSSRRDPAADQPATAFTETQLMDPTSCKDCHPKHYTEWSGSMHAYASDDPVFVAMNRRGQAETNGQLGTFCVQCHAPMAAKAGATTDGLNLASLAPNLRGVTCYFCHSVDGIDDAHDFNNPLHLADDGTMRGEYSDPVANPAHRATYSNLHDRDKIESARMCGTCHDIVTSHGARIERTFQEWQISVFAQPKVGTTCGQCHMDQSSTLEAVASNVPNIVARRTHSHMFPAVDTATSPFPEADAQKTAVQTLLDSSLQSAVCVRGTGDETQLVVILDNVASGHGLPSGAAQDRRLWAEVTAFVGDQQVYQSGVVPAGTPVTTLADPDLWLLRDCMFDGAGAPVAMFWQAASYDTNQLPVQLTFNQTDIRYYRTHIYKTYPNTGAILQTIDRVKLRMRLEPIGLDVASDLVTTHYLDPAVREPVTNVGADLVWTADTATEQYSDRGIPMSCISATNLSAAADRVPAKLHCDVPAEVDAGATDDGDDGDDGGSDQVSCVGDPRVDTYSANLDKLSSTGLHIAIQTADPAPPAKGINQWTVVINDGNNAPVDNATVILTPFMPDHGHGTSIKPVTTPLGGGRYGVNPLYLFMPGVWRVNVAVQINGVADAVNFFFCIEG